MPFSTGMTVHIQPRSFPASIPQTSSDYQARMMTQNSNHTFSHHHSHSHSHSHSYSHSHGYAHSQPSSPLTTKFKTATGIDPTQVVPLDDTQRAHPIHPSLPSIKLTQATPADLNPLTLKPFTAEELKHHNYTSLRSQYTTTEAADKARDEAVEELRSRLEENERKTREVEREMEQKEKTRELERKVFMKKRGEVGAG